MFKSKIAAKLAAYFALAVLVFAFVMAFSFGHFFRENFIERQQRGLAYRAASVAAIMGDNLERSRLREAREAREKNAGETAAGTENKSGSGTEAPAVSGQSAKAGPAAGSKAVNPGSLLRSRRLIAYVNIITADDVWVANILFLKAPPQSIHSPRRTGTCSARGSRANPPCGKSLTSGSTR